MSDASTETLKAQEKKGKPETDRQRIMDYLAFKDGMTSKDLSDTLGIEWSTFCARLSQLIDKGVIYYDGTETFFDQTHSIVKYEHNKEKQKLRAAKVKKGKLLKVLKSLKRNYSPLISDDLMFEIELELLGRRK